MGLHSEVIGLDSVLLRCCDGVRLKDSLEVPSQHTKGEGGGANSGTPSTEPMNVIKIVGKEKSVVR